jgi:hypothetical protein
MTYCWSPALVPRPRDWPAHIGMRALSPSASKMTDWYRCVWLFLLGPSCIHTTSRSGRVPAIRITPCLHRFRQYCRRRPSKIDKCRPRGGFKGWCTCNHLERVERPRWTAEPERLLHWGLSSRVALSTCCCGGSSRWCWNHCLWSLERTANRHRALLRRVSPSNPLTLT